jgi:hypothetical protein
MTGLFAIKNYQKWEFLPSFISKQTCYRSFCHLLWANKHTMGVFAIFYGHTNLPWEFLPSFMGKQTYHGSFCHLLWANKPVVRIFAIFYGQTNLS